MPETRRHRASSRREPARGARRAAPRKGPALRIVHEDGDLLVVEKPPGMLSARPGPEASGAPGAFELLRERFAPPAGRARDGSGLWLVHRLDRDASGLLAFARSRRAFHWLKDDLRAHRVERRYAAVVKGELEPGSSGSLDSFLSTAPGRVKSTAAARFRGRAPGPGGAEPEARFARTHYRVLAAGRGHSLLELSLDTGRRHQIRVHLESLGHPIAGDRLYGGARGARLFLHAASLAFEHPATGQRIALASPLPEEFAALLGVSAASLPALGSPPAERAAPPAPARPAASRRAGAKHSPVPGESGSQARAGKRSARAPVAEGAQDTSWEGVADWYDRLLDERGSDHYRDLVLPGMLRLLAPAAGQRVLDVACGQGAFCRALAELGVEAVGIDAAPRLIELAQQRARRVKGRAPHHQVADARALGELDLGRFHAVTCVLGLMNIDPIEPLLQGAARQLEPEGCFVAVISHPAFRAPRQSSWGWERDAQGAHHQYRRVDGYLSPARVRIVANPGAVARGEPAIETWTFHRPLEHYVRALAAAGFSIERLEEWTSLRSSQPGPRAAEENRVRGEIPLFLGLRARLRAAQSAPAASRAPRPREDGRR